MAKQKKSQSNGVVALMEPTAETVTVKQNMPEAVPRPITASQPPSPAGGSRTPTVVLKPREERRLRIGHCWVFSNEIDRVKGEAELGSVVRVRAHSGERLGAGIYNPNSLIAVRMIGRNYEQALDAGWFDARIQRALALRRQLYPDGNACRLLHSESDGVPGVIADRYGEVIVLQIASAAMEQRKEMLADALMSIDGVRGIVERNDHSLRMMEGLIENVGVLRGEAPPQIISDGFLRYHVDPLGGQKTGFYLDQRENRIAMRRFMGSGARVLDLFCNSGGFALHARHAGAGEVVAVDSSQRALLELEANRKLNALAKITVCAADVFSELHERGSRDEKFDIIIADPPPFARSRKHVSAARKHYVTLFTRVLRLLAPNGTAMLSTCSYHITRETFFEMLRESCAIAQRDVMILEERGAAPDHPVHPAMPETGYLHAAIIRAAF